MGGFASFHRKWVKPRLELFLGRFCAVKEMSSDSSELLVSCCELGISDLPKNGQEGKRVVVC